MFEHDPCDAVVPAAQRIACAVRDDDVPGFLDGIAAARTHGGPQWTTALIVTLAAMVPVEAAPSRLLAWMEADPL